jgi:hypothetical protein
MFHRKFVEHCRSDLADDGVENIHLVADDKMEEAIAKAREQASIENPMFSLPTGVMVVDGQVGAVFDGHIRKKIKEWFQSPQGKAFKEILKKIVIGLIIAIITGS